MGTGRSRDDGASRMRGRRGRRRRRVVAAALVAVGLVAPLGGCSSDGDDAARDPGSTPVAATDTTTTTTSTVPAPEAALVIAHRGASGHAPEHTFAAYDLALEQGADHLEQDLQMTSDGVLVVLHDPVLDRTARGPAESCTGLVADKTLAQLRECEVGSWFNEANPERADPAFVGEPIQTMAEVLERYGTDVRYYIELKTPDGGAPMEAPLVALLDEAGLLEPSTPADQVIVQSFGADVLRTMHGLQPQLALVQLLVASGTPIDVSVLDGAREYAIGIGPAKANVDAALVAAAHERCLVVHPYTVDDPVEMTQLLDLGVDGIFTNVPDVLRTAVQGRPAPPVPCAGPASG